MARQAHQERVLLLHANAHELRNLGGKWNLDDAAVDSCVQLSLSRSRRTNLCDVNGLWRLTVVLLIVGLSIGCVCVCEIGIPESVAAHVEYHIMRAIRLIAAFYMPRFSTQTDYYTEECIVKNPLWVDWDIDCEVCKLATKVTEFKNPRKELDIDTFRIPAVFKNLMPRGVTLEDVTSVILHSKVDLSRPIQSTADWSGTAVDFANNATVDKIAKSHGFQFHWKSDFNLEVGRLMRTLFPRPLVFEKELEVSVKKYLYVDGPNSEGYSLPDWEVGFAWYTQGFGVRTVTFTPVQQCTDQCSSFQMNVAQRDVLIYPVGYWVVSVLSNGEDLSISYMGVCE